MTVYNIIAEPIRYSGTRLEKQNMDKRVRKLMDTVGLASRLIKAYPMNWMGQEAADWCCPGIGIKSKIYSVR